MREPATTPPAAPVQTDQHTILVVDDDIDTLDLVEAFFRPKGYKIKTFENPEALLAGFKSNTVCGDVLIIDLMMPKMSGLELTKQLQAMGIEIPVVLITASGSVQNAVEAIEAGAYDFVVKPLHFQQLYVSVERAIHFRTIKRQNTALRNVVKMKESVAEKGVIGRSPGILNALDLAKRVAPSKANVYIYGESGTGKEVIAKVIHQSGPRANQPFVAINCSSIPENLLESELFGHAKGSFTGAHEKKIGLFEEASGGTLFLDEIGDLSLPLQAKLLRVIQERQIRRIGENQFRPIDTRIISATHKDLRMEVKEHRFREDLFFRLNVIQISIPPLRQRKEDIIPLADFFLEKYAALNNSKVRKISREAYERLLEHSWPGNVRELENAIERAVVLSVGPEIIPDDLPEQSYYLPDNDASHGDPSEEITAGPILTADEMMKKYIVAVLKRNNWAREKTARDLNIDRKTLYRKLQEMGDIGAPRMDH
jgi:two-component system response regulator HydG